MKKSLVVYIFVLMFGAVQAQAVEYKNSYGGYRPAVGGSFGSTYRATAPSVSFQSTSAYSDQWANETAILNADGSVNTEAYGVGRNNAPGGPRKIVNPGEDDDKENPIGDALFPLLLLAAGYAVYRRRKTRTLGY